MWLTQDIGAQAPAADDDYWYQPIGMITTSGQAVSPETAMRLSAVWACVKVLSETLAQLPIHIYRRRSDGGKERATNHPLYRLLHDQPNAWQTSYEFVEMVQGHAVLRGNGYCEIISGPDGQIRELIPLHPDRIKIEMISERNWRYRYQLSDATTRTLARGQVLHIRGFSADGIVGMNPIEYEREAVGMGLAAQDYGARFYRNGAQPGGVIEWEGSFSDNEARRNFRESWQAAQAGVNRHKTAVLEKGMRYHELGIKHTDAQYLETRSFQVEEIARIFRVPPHMIQKLDKATFSNIEQQAIEFVVGTMMPWIRRWEQALTRDLITYPERYFVEIAVDGLLRGDAKSRAEFYKSGITSGWLAPNEARIKENLNPLPGLDAPLRPLNMERTDQPSQQDQQSAGQALAAERARAIMESAADRIVRRETQALHRIIDRAESASEIAENAMEFYLAHASHIAEVLRIDESAAHDYTSAEIARIGAGDITHDWIDAQQDRKRRALLALGEAS